MKNALNRVLIISISLLVLIAGLVIVTDPFYHYHAPVLGLKKVLTEKEYQCIGSIRHFDYDAVIAGSSVAENYNNAWFDEKYGCTSIKAIRSYGATADLCYFVSEAFKANDLKYVFYNLDPSSLKSSTYTTFEETGCPMYLYDHNPFNDLAYLFNKDVIFERIPYNIARSFAGDYDEGASYNWWQWKEFNLAMCTGLYLRHPAISPMKDEHVYDTELEGNIALIEELVANHSDTVFYIFIPPYSMLWWDNAYREGETDFYLYAMEKAVNRLSSYNNVKFSFYMNDREIITNLDSNYMDTLHFSPEINRYICDTLADSEHLVDSSNSRAVIDNMRELADEITDSLMEPYIGMIKEDIE